MRRNLCGRMTVGAMVVLLAAGVATAQNSAADGAVLLEDNFEFLDPGWGEESQWVKLSEGALNLISGVDEYVRCRYQGEVYNDANISVECCLDSGPEGSYGGLLFWVAGYDDYYVLEYDTVGDACVARVAKDKRTTFPMPWKHVDAVKKDRKEKNVLRVETRGKLATVYINGQKIATVKGQPPTGGGFVGFCGGSSKGGGATWKFRNLKITAPAAG